MLVFLIVMLVVFLAFGLAPLILMWAWNIVMPTLFGLQEVSFVQAFAVVLLLGFVRSFIHITVNKE